MLTSWYTRIELTVKGWAQFSTSNVRTIRTQSLALRAVSQRAPSHQPTVLLKPTMDPASLVGVLSAAGGIVQLIIQTVKKLNELRERFQEANVTIRLLMSELLTVRAALQQVDDWTKYSWTPATPVQEDLQSAFEISIDGCTMAMELLSDEVDELLGHDTGESFIFRIKSLWKEDMMTTHQQRLHTQVGALQLLLQAIQM
jgi:hypothetical protein